MTVNELGQILKNMYEEAPSGEKTTMIHLFGVKYAQIMRDYGYTAKEVIEAAKMHESYQTEVHKGIKLAKYVAVK